MKKTIVIIMLLTGMASLQAQSFVGYLTDNYSGLNSVIINPANIVDSRFKTDINLVGISAFAGNDYYSAKFGDITKKDFDFDVDGKKSPKLSNNFYGNADILGPSFMFNLNERSSLAIFTRGRVVTRVNDLNGETFDKLEDDFDENSDYNINEGDAYSSANAWAEIGVSYARVFLNKEQHFVKGGVSLKYLQGYGNAYGYGNNLLINYDADGTALPGGNTTGSIQSDGTITYAHSDNIENNFDDYKFEKSGTGFGADLGVIYEWRPNYDEYTSVNSEGKSYSPKDVNKYKLKLGLSLTDLGSINYKNGTENTYNIQNTISEDDFDSIDGIEDKLNNLYTLTSANNISKAILPTTLHVNADWSMNRHFYLNLNTDLSLTSKKKGNTGRYANTVALTPRFESKWFSFYSPLSLVQNVGFQWGAGLRMGPLYIGSGSIISVLTSKESKSADVYAGLKIPIYQSRPKDKDSDGVLDKVDDCPETHGPVENNGCPWPDSDNDKVLDKDDKCPEEAGPVENNGCPWEDTDNDTLLDKDDKCPEEAGPVENNGCPLVDSDTDGILDKDDKCPDVMGTVANNGCPEVTEAIQKTLNEYAKTILFNSAKASIKVESTQVLIDIIKILQEYPNAKFSIEGHTDSIGSAVNNQKLSEARALSVKDFLIEKGIDSARLKSKGFGEEKPIATNMYKDGRSKNRRVEINLIK